MFAAQRVEGVERKAGRQARDGRRLADLPPRQANEARHSSPDDRQQHPMQAPTSPLRGDRSRAARPTTAAPRRIQSKKRAKKQTYCRQEFVDSRSQRDPKVSLIQFLTLKLLESQRRRQMRAPGAAYQVFCLRKPERFLPDGQGLGGIQRHPETGWRRAEV
jgi:hypothetical protein